MWLNDSWTTRMSPEATDFSPTLSGDLAEKTEWVSKGLHGLVRQGAPLSGSWRGSEPAEQARGVGWPGGVWARQIKWWPFQLLFFNYLAILYLLESEAGAGGGGGGRLVSS